MSRAKSKPPTFTSGMVLTADLLQQLSDWCWQNRTIFGESFTTNRTVAGQVVEVAGGVGSSSTILATCVATSTITAATSVSPPGTLGSGTAKLDVESGTNYTAGASITIYNRFPISTWGTGDLFVIRSNDGGTTWHIVNRYCP